MSAAAIDLAASPLATSLPTGEHRAPTLCLGIALGVGLLSWAVLASLVGIVLA